MLVNRKRRRVREDDGLEIGPELPVLPCHRLTEILDGPGDDAAKVAAIRKLVDAAHHETVRAGESISRAAFARHLYRGVYPSF